MMMTLKHATLHAAAHLTENVAENLSEATVLEMDDLEQDIAAAHILLDHALTLEPRQTARSIVDEAFRSALTR